MKRMEYGRDNKEVLVLLHGGGLSWWNFRKEAELLGDRFHVVLPISSASKKTPTGSFPISTGSSAGTS